MTEFRVLMSFRADEVEVGDYVALPFGPAEVTAVQRAGLAIAITVGWPTEVEGEGEHTIRPMPHEHVCLWEKR